MIRIPEDILQSIIEQAQNERPNEACGYLAGSDGTARLRIPLTNVDASPEHFSLDPREQFQALLTARDQECRLIAVYHSHPDTPARMSDEDIRLANDPNMVYVITSLQTGQTKAFSVDKDKTVTAVPVKVVSTKPAAT